jgi:hypothetical protein
MTVYRGTAVIAGQYVQINAPQGFGAINGLRLTNYTGMTVLLNNIASTGQSQEYLFPQQQMVYHTRNISIPPTAQGFLTHAAFSPNLLYVEWSDDSINDFIGTYPAFLPAQLVANSLGSPVILTVHAPTTVAIAPPAVNDSVQFNSINGVQTAGPLTIPVGFQLDITGVQITATYSGAIGIAQFTIDVGTMVGGVITHIYQQALFVLQKTALADNPISTIILSPNLGQVVVPAGQTPVFIFDTGPVGVTYSGTVTGTLLPTS